ncbi:MAG TPA: hybrid sensor histidine kinase/response regulator [Vicinamibacterales bacterium]|nr:hybrid sensor histidine kinase/response regulator [Vicinamibacterales bacterium]
MAGLGLRALEEQQRRQSARVGLELSRSVANAVDAELRSAVAILETLATSPTLDGDIDAEFRRRAERVLHLRPTWAAIVLADPHGTPLVDTRSSAAGTLRPILDEESFERAVRTRSAVAGNLTRAAQTDWYFPVRVPVIRGGAVKFILSAIITPEAIRNVLERQQLPSDWVISIVDARGVRVARSRGHEQNLGGRLSDTAQRVVAQGGAEGFGISYTLENERILTPYTRLASGWMAVLGLPTALADAAAYQALAIYGGGLLLSIALGAFAAVWVARTITQPIDALRIAAQALGEGRRPVPPMTDLQEIRDVGDALTSAAEALDRASAEREDLLRKERVAREAAESADRAKDEFMAVLSHELRTPLNAVFGWAKMLQDGQLRDAAAERRAKSAIVRNADIQMQLIDDLLDLSRIARGKLRLELGRVELPQVMQAALDAVRPAAASKNVALQTSIDPDAVACADPGRLQQVVWNLLTNAVKFTPSGGTVELRLERCGSHVEIVVRDTGQGIAPEMLPHVFERFRQGDSSSTRPHGGLGIGLALVKHLVEQHGGTVSAQSPGAGQGATFRVTLPPIPHGLTESTPTPAMPSGAPADVTRLEGMRVIVVDDDADGLALAEDILLRAGADVRACTSAAPAFDIVRNWMPDVLVADIEMPGEDGYSLIQRVRSLSIADGGATPAIALTAYGRPTDRARALAAGFNMHVPKPIDPMELTTIVAGIAGLAQRSQAAQIPSAD